MSGLNALVLTAVLSAGPFVSADVLTVRAEPDAASRAVDQLRLNEEVTQVGEARDGWVALSAPVNGWVRADFLRPTPLTLEEALQAADAATGEASRTWLERAVAIEPTRVQLWRRLRTEYEKHGPADRARFAAATLRGGLTTYFLLRGEEVGWQAVTWVPGQGWRPLAVTTDGERRPLPPQAAFNALRTARVTSIGRDSTTTLPGTPLRGLAVDASGLDGVPPDTRADTVLATQPWVAAPARKGDDAAVLRAVRDAALRDPSSKNLDVQVRVTSATWLRPLDASAPVRLGLATWSVSYVERGDPRHQLKSMTREGLALTVLRDGKRSTSLFGIGTLTD